MNEQSSQLRGWTRRNFLKVLGVTGASMMFPWLAYAAESDELDAKADEMEGQLSSMQAQADEMAARLSSLQEEVNAAFDRYNQAIAAHDAAVASMEEAQGRIDAANERITQLQSQLSSRAASIYKTGQVNFIDVLFGSNSFDEFLKNWDAMERIEQQDEALIAETKAARQEAQDAYAEYQRQEQIAAEEMAAAEAAKEELEAAQAALQAEYDAMAEDIAATQAEIEQVRMDAEEARKKEEEARIAAEQALAQSQNQGSSSSGGSTAPSVSGWCNPAPGTYITSGFGWRSLGDFHLGVDLSCNYQTVYAMADGTVSHSGWFSTGGMSVIINHGGGIVSWYLHGSQLLVSAGQSVSAGQPIMVSGNSGYSTGPHLHFQINVNSPDGISGTAVDPTAYFGW